MRRNTFRQVRRRAAELSEKTREAGTGTVLCVTGRYFERGCIMRIWGKIWKDNHMLRDTVAEDWSEESRTHKVFHLLEEICMTFDLMVPQWLDSNISEFQKTSKTRFTADSFIESIDFDFLEFQVIEE